MLRLIALRRRLHLGRGIRRRRPAHSLDRDPLQLLVRCEEVLHLAGIISLWTLRAHHLRRPVFRFSFA